MRRDDELTALLMIPQVRELIQWLRYEELIQNAYLDYDTPITAWCEALDAMPPEATP